MKKIIVTLAALAILIPASAQNNARKIISLTPALPTVKDLLEAYKEEYPEEFLTAMEEAELKDDIKQCEEYCKRFTKLTGEEA